MGFDQPCHQLTYAYKGLGPELQTRIDEPRTVTTVDEFLDAIERKKIAWLDVYSQPTYRGAPSNYPERRATSQEYVAPNRRFPSASNEYTDPNKQFTPRTFNSVNQQRYETPRRDIRPSAEQSGNQERRDWSRSSYSPRPWNGNRSSTPGSSWNRDKTNRTSTPEPARNPVPAFKREGSEQISTPYSYKNDRQTPSFRTRAYHSAETT